jgi:hypothetical protein
MISQVQHWPNGQWDRRADYSAMETVVERSAQAMAKSGFYMSGAAHDGQGRRCRTRRRTVPHLCPDPGIAKLTGWKSCKVRQNLEKFVRWKSRKIAKQQRKFSVGEPTSHSTMPLKGLEGVGGVITPFAHLRKGGVGRSNLRIVDPDMNDVPHDGKSAGEIVLRSPSEACSSCISPSSCNCARRSIIACVEVGYLSTRGAGDDP